MCTTFYYTPITSPQPIIAKLYCCKIMDKLPLLGLVVQSKYEKKKLYPEQIPRKRFIGFFFFLVVLHVGKNILKVYQNRVTTKGPNVTSKNMAAKAIKC